MTVTRIQQINNSRYRVYVDDRVFCVLYKGELKTYGIIEGVEITEETYELIRSEVLASRAKKRAMNLLMKHSFTEHKLREKLLEGDYPEDIVDLALDYVIGYGYVDDRRYVKDYISSHNMDKSIRRITNDLISKGISQDIIREELDAASDTEFAVDEEAQIRHLLHKRHFDMNAADAAQIRKECAYLAGKGFSTEIIRHVMHDLIPD
ncbi:MAG: recombination regulator RecX [Lachnospiraceae bacterium]|nr:recombination regulator RecX [Lachnospiraceae bacterium]